MRRLDSGVVALLVNFTTVHALVDFEKDAYVFQQGVG